jgi:soluble lytic murein transglycosylase-like protein
MTSPAPLFAATFIALAVCAALSTTPVAAQTSPYDAIIASQAAANGVPVALVHRIIVRESRYQPQLIGRGGAIGLMQIKLPTARGVGYTGTAEGLRDPEANLTYGIRYLAGAYRTANGNHDRAVAYYAGGYYYAAKRQHQQQSVGAPLSANALQIH